MNNGQLGGDRYMHDLFFYNKKMSRTFKYIALLFLLTAVTKTYAQVDAFANIRLNRSEAFPKQPIKATITVYTATWFTQPLDIDNLQVANSFVIPFKRTLSTMHEIGGKKYASLEFYYLIYPYERGDYTIPSINIRMETPPAGDFKGIAHTVSTKPLKFSVLPIPKQFDGKEWFVAKNVRLSQSWDHPLNNLKVGDVIERTVTIDANGTLPNFVPELSFEDVPFGSVYVKAPQLKDRRTNQDVNGTRIEKVIYLLEEKGEFDLPGITVDWWDPYSQKALFRTMEATRLSISDNPDLGMMKTLKDSLSMVSGVISDSSESAPQSTIFGLKKWQFALIVALGFSLLLLIVRWTKMVVIRIQQKIKRYRNSEKWWFNRIKRSTKQTPEEIFNSIYSWWDVMKVDHDLPPSIHEALVERQAKGLKTTWEELEASIFNNSNPRTSGLISELVKFRKDVLKHKNDHIHVVSHLQTKW